MKFLSAAVMAIVLAITFWAFTRVPENIPNKFPVRSSSSYSSSITVLEEELDLPISRTYSSRASSIPIQPTIEEKKYRAPYKFNQFKSSSLPSKPSFSSQSSSSSVVHSSSSVSYKSAYCLDDTYLALYTDPASKAAAIRAHTKICR